MAKFNIQRDCGNSPRKELLKRLYLALANGEIQFFLDNTAEEIMWHAVEIFTVSGKENFLEALVNHQLWKPDELTIETIITHGIDASVSGHLTTVDSSKFTFCDIYRFNRAGGSKITGITTFLIRSEIRITRDRHR